MRKYLDAARARRRIATQATVCIATPLIVLVALGHPTSAVIAMQGGFAGFYAFDAPRARRGRIVAAVGVALVLATVLGTLVAGSEPLIGLAGGVFAAAAAYVCMTLHLGPPREYFIVFSYLVATGLPVEPGAAVERGALVLLGAALAWVIAMTSGPRKPVPGPPPSEGPHVAPALRVGLAVALGTVVGAVIGAGHPYWIALSAVAVLQGTHLHVTLRRAAHRTAGTLVGLLGAAAILAPAPPVGVLVAVIVVMQFLTESVIAVSYGVAVVFITSLALVGLEIAHPAFGAGLLGARALDTVLGCALGCLLGAAARR